MTNTPRSRVGRAAVTLQLALVTVSSLAVDTVHAQQGWQPAPTGLPDNVYGFDFLDDQTGFAVAWGSSPGAVILATTDGGATWSTRIPQPETILFAIHFLDRQRGFAVGQDGAVDEGIILSTVDGGLTWEGLRLPETFGLYDVQFPTPTTGYVCGWDGGIYKTLDAGTTWTKLDTRAPAQVFRSLSFVDEQTGFALGGSAFAGGRLYRTTDGGATWENRGSPTGVTLSALSFINANEGVTVGYRNGREAILRTPNGGGTWHTVHRGPSTSVLQAVHLRGLRGWAVGSSEVLHTDDGGRTWRGFAAPPLSIGLAIHDAGGQLYVGDNAVYRLGVGSAACSFRNGSGINPTGFACTNTPVVGGGTWDSTVVTTPDTMATFVAVGAAPATLPFLGGELLVAATPAPAVLNGLGAHALPIPLNVGLLGTQLATQGLRLQQPPTGAARLELLNALDLTLGLLP
ncbi:MAG: YCF48-related protein [Planctomycetota bacterium]